MLFVHVCSCACVHACRAVVMAAEVLKRHRHNRISSVVSFHRHHQLIGAGGLRLTDVNKNQRGSSADWTVSCPEAFWAKATWSLFTFFAQCIPESQLNPGFAWSGPNFRFASMEDFGAARLTQFLAPFLWLALAVTVRRPLAVGEFVTKG